MGSFKTNPWSLEELLKDSERGVMKLPDFQRGWVWDEDRIKSLIASVSLAFPIGALMRLETGGEVQFKERPVEGAPKEAEGTRAQYLLLDGQQRITSLYQSCLRRDVVNTVLTSRSKRVGRYFYININKSLDAYFTREDAIIGVPEDRIIRTNFGRDIFLDLSSSEREYEEQMFPLNYILDGDSCDDWRYEFESYWHDRENGGSKRQLFRKFTQQVLRNFTNYDIPVITLDRDTTKEAVCLVFEKVNTGGKPLDTFELITATYAAQNYNLREDWLGVDSDIGRRDRLARFGHSADQQHGTLAKVGSTDFLQGNSLIHTKARRKDAESEGKSGRELPPISATRQALLALPLSAYVKHADHVEQGFKDAAKFLRRLSIFRVFDLPYQSQLVPLAAILAELGPRSEHATIHDKLAEWYWNGVFGELYGSATESRFARDVAEVPNWVIGGPQPATIADSVFRVDRLEALKSRVSAAYKGVNALLMSYGARDFRSSQTYNDTVFFNEGVDIHHIFPRAWCRANSIESSKYESIINKTPLSWRTNRILGGDAPSRYLGRLEDGVGDSPPIAASTINSNLKTHLIDPSLLRADDFYGFFEQRKAALVTLIEGVTKKTAFGGHETNEPEQEVSDLDLEEAIS